MRYISLFLAIVAVVLCGASVQAQCPPLVSGGGFGSFGGGFGVVGGGCSTGGCNTGVGLGYGAGYGGVGFVGAPPLFLGTPPVLVTGGFHRGGTVIVGGGHVGRGGAVIVNQRRGLGGRSTVIVR